MGALQALIRRRRRRRVYTGVSPSALGDPAAANNDGNDNSDANERRRHCRRQGNGAAAAESQFLLRALVYLLLALARIPGSGQVLVVVIDQGWRRSRSDLPGPPTASTSRPNRRPPLPSVGHLPSSSSTWMVTNTPFFLNQARVSDQGRNDTLVASPSSSALAALALVSASASAVEGAVDVDVDSPPRTSGDSADSLPPLLRKIADKFGKIDKSRMVPPPGYLSSDAPNLFSNMRYDVTGAPPSLGTKDNVFVVSARRSTANDVLSLSALLCGKALGCGLLFPPTAIGLSGYVPGARSRRSSRGLT
jgi:hypothetical protein